MVETPEVTPIESSFDVYCSDLSEVLLYLTTNEEQHKIWKTVLENVYNHLSLISSNDTNLCQKILLPKLLVQNFDDEQIWQQIELLNSVVIEHVGTEINKNLTPKISNNSIKENPVQSSNEQDFDKDSESESLPDENEVDLQSEKDGNIQSNEPSTLLFNLNDMDKFCEELENNNKNDSEDESAADIFGADHECEESDECEENDDIVESKLEKNLKMVLAKISAHEDEALKEKSWKMLGESSQRDRETNALLEEHLQFDHGVRPAPDITLETTNKLEKLIIDRIRTKFFDDVERKEKPLGRDKMKQKELSLNQEKSQLSLAEVYEKDYLALQEKVASIEKEEINENEESIKNDLANLFRKLDALSNFVYTPKGVRDELKIVVNAPAISMEDAIPTAVSEAQILAPSEVKAKQKEELRSTLEETQTDKKRKRRKIKKSKSIKSNERELKKLKLERENGGKKIKSKSDAVSLVAEEVKQGIKLAKKSSEKVNSNFFSKLQDSINEDPASGKKHRKKPKEVTKKFNKF